MMPTVQMENVWWAGQIPTILPYSITQRIPPASTLAAGIQVPTQILHEFVSIDSDSRLPDRQIFKKFPWSQHLPSLITPPRFPCPVSSKPVKRWNFQKAKCSHYITLTNKLARTLPPPDTDQAYQCFCNASALRRKSVYRGRGQRNNHIPCWNGECEKLYQTFLQYPEGHESSRAATALLSRLDRKWRNRWSEAVQNIDFSHSSRVAWSTLNNLTARSRQFPRQCPVSENAIASQLVKNGK